MWAWFITCWFSSYWRSTKLSSSWCFTWYSSKFSTRFCNQENNCWCSSFKIKCFALAYHRYTKLSTWFDFFIHLFFFLVWKRICFYQNIFYSVTRNSVVSTVHNLWCLYSRSNLYSERYSPNYSICKIERDSCYYWNRYTSTFWKWMEFRCEIWFGKFSCLCECFAMETVSIFMWKIQKSMKIIIWINFVVYIKILHSTTMRSTKSNQ